MTEKEIEKTYYKIYKPIVKLYELLDSSKFSESEVKKFTNWIHKVTSVHEDMVKAIRKLNKEVNEIRKEKQNGNN